MATVYTYAPAFTVDSALYGDLLGLTALQDGRFALTLAKTHDTGAGAATDSLGLAPVAVIASELTASLALPRTGGALAQGRSIAQLTDGSFLAVAERETEDGTQVLAQRLGPGGAARGAAQVLGGDLDGASAHVQVLALADGGYALAWAQVNGTDPEAGWDLRLQAFDASGAARGAALTFGGYGDQGSTAGSFDLTQLKDGHLVETWIDGIALQMQILGLDGSAAEPILVDARWDASYTLPQVVALADGGFALTWLVETVDFSTGSTTRAINLQVFEADGTARSQITRIDHATGSEGFEAVLSDVSIVALADGRLAMAWNTSWPDGMGGVRQSYNLQLVTAQGAKDGHAYGLGENDGAVVGSGLVALADGRFAASWSHDGTTEVQIFEPREAGVTLTGHGLADTFLGTVLNDSLYGGAGRDILSGWVGHDLLSGGMGGDLLDGGRGADLVYGGQGADRLWGRQGNDQLFGGQGDDRLIGGLGADRLTGGAGADVFVFAPGDGRDRITDFAVGEDHLDLSAYDFASLTEARAHFADQGSDLLFALGTDQILLRGLSLAALQEGDLLI